MICEGERTVGLIGGFFYSRTPWKFVYIHQGKASCTSMYRLLTLSALCYLVSVRVKCLCTRKYERSRLLTNSGFVLVCMRVSAELAVMQYVCLSQMRPQTDFLLSLAERRSCDVLFSCWQCSTASRSAMSAGCSRPSRSSTTSAPVMTTTMIMMIVVVVVIAICCLQSSRSQTLHDQLPTVAYVSTFVLY